MKIAEEKIRMDQILGWQRILSPGHIWVSRLNSAWLSPFVAPRVAILSVAFVASVIFILINVYSWMAPKYKRMLEPPAISSESSNDDLKSNMFDFSKMVEGAVSDGFAPMASYQDFSADLLKSVIIPLGDGKLSEVSATALPEIGKPWPIDAVVYKKLVGDAMFVGARLKTNTYGSQAGAVWMGMARKIGGKWEIYNFVPSETSYGVQLVRLPQLENVNDKMIPRVINSLSMS